jgi:hypothetical protein
VPGMGYIATCTDTENNGFGIFEADQTAKWIMACDCI